MLIITNNDNIYFKDIKTMYEGMWWNRNKNMKRTKHYTALAIH